MIESRETTKIQEVAAADEDSLQFIDAFTAYEQFGHVVTLPATALCSRAASVAFGVCAAATARHRAVWAAAAHGMNPVVAREIAREEPAEWDHPYKKAREFLVAACSQADWRYV